MDVSGCGPVFLYISLPPQIPEDRAKAETTDTKTHETTIRKLETDPGRKPGADCTSELASFCPADWENTRST